MSVITPTLTTPRLTLRPFKEEDYPSVYKWCSSLVVTKFLFWFPHRDEEVTKRLVRSWVRKRRNYSWAIVMEDEPIGEVEIIKELPNNGVELGYTLREDKWGQGLMSEALNEVFLFLKNDKKVAFIYCETDSRNMNSKKLLERLGFSFIENKPYHIAKKNEDVTLSAYRKDF